jgi:crotonobetainyl-CoA:carnitine CoA-transferase CaiB-like acyl-CoA transferase
MMQQVLSGVKVIDATMFAFMPVAGGVLAHWGADVIKVESPGACDPMRVLFGGTTEPGGAYMSFKNYNRGKRAVAIDLSTEDGRSILYRLVEHADVFLTSYLPETRKKLKVDVEDIRKCNPNIIYAKGTGFGPLGPERERRGYDAAAWWARGSLADSAMQGSGSEWPTGMVGHGDTISGTVLAGGICAALLQRERTGVATVVDGSLLGTAIWYNHQPIVASGLGLSWGGAGIPREERSPTSNAYRTSDGRFVSLVFVNDPDVDWADLCKHLDRPDLATDPRFATGAGRSANRAEAVRLLDDIFSERSLAEWKKVLVTTRGVWAPVQTASEIHEDPQTIANGFIRQVQYANGPISLPVPPVLFDEEAGDIKRAPEYCEHTDEVLREAGLSNDEIARYHAAGVIA